MAEKKNTRLDYFNILKTIAEGSIFEYKDEVLNFIDREIELIHSKNERQQKAIEKKHELHAVAQEYIKNIISDGNTWTREEIVEALNEDCYNIQLSKGTVSNLCNNLVKEGEALKTTVRRDNNTRIVAFKSAE